MNRNNEVVKHATEKIMALSERADQLALGKRWEIIATYIAIPMLVIVLLLFIATHTPSVVIENDDALMIHVWYQPVMITTIASAVILSVLSVTKGCLMIHSSQILYDVAFRLRRYARKGVQKASS